MHHLTAGRREAYGRRRPLRGLAACALAAIVAAPGAGHAEDAKSRSAPWIITLGAWAVLEPAFEGSRSLQAAGRPLVMWRRADSREWLSLPNDGFDFELVETDTFRAGPVASWSWMRADPHLHRGYRNVGAIDLSAEAGVFAEYWPAPWLRARVEIRDGVWGAKGWVADLNADLVWRPLAGLTVTGGPRLSLADARFMRTNYGISDEQAAASGLAPYAAEAGFRTAGLGTAIKRDWSPTWSTIAFVEYHRLIGPADNSPVIDAPGTSGQLTVGVGFSYSFAVQD